jgi:hypothetical protein
MQMILISLILWVLPSLVLLALSFHADKDGPALERYGRPFGPAII